MKKSSLMKASGILCIILSCIALYLLIDAINYLVLLLEYESTILDSIRTVYNTEEEVIAYLKLLSAGFAVLRFIQMIVFMVFGIIILKNTKYDNVLKHKKAIITCLVLAYISTFIEISEMISFAVLGLSLTIGILLTCVISNLDKYRQDSEKSKIPGPLSFENKSTIDPINTSSMAGAAEYLKDGETTPTNLTVNQLKSLQHLYESGIITQTEYLSRIRTVVDKPKSESVIESFDSGGKNYQSSSLDIFDIKSHDDLTQNKNVFDTDMTIKKAKAEEKKLEKKSKKSNDWDYR